jgi:Tol biopolymer transport system component
LWLVCTFASLANAATYDPDLTWRTLVTPHFRIHFHQGLESLADDFAVTTESIYGTMTEEMRWRPRRRTHVVLIDRTDAANGFASSVPYNAITIFVTAPTDDSTLSLYQDWHTAIQTHEFTHTLHIDTQHGIVRAARWVVGRIASTNRLSPAWMIEGLATLEETRHTPGGRGRNPAVDMILRTSALENDIPPLGRMEGLQAAWPGGQIRYLHGQDFMQYVADRQGDDVWTRWTHHYGSGLPYLLPGKRILGASIRSLHRGWTDDLRQRAEATKASVEAAGPLTDAKLLSDPGASCTAPSFAPTGEHLVWSCWDPTLGSRIWRADGTGAGAKVLLVDRGARTFGWRADGSAFAYAGTHVVNRFNTWSDVYLHTLGAQGVTALTQGARARDPEFSPDGSRLLVVTNRAQTNRLQTLTVDRRETTVWDPPANVQIANPRYSPDGASIVASVWEEGRRDLWLFRPDGTPARRLTADDANDRDPRFSRDGRWLLFSSDRSGVPQIYAVDVQSERLWQVTRVATGASAPDLHPDGHTLVYQEYHATGWQVVSLEFTPSTWLDRGTLPRATRYDTPLVDLVGPAREPPATVHWEGEPTRRTRGAPVDPVATPLPGLDRSRAWVGELPPVAMAQDPGGLDSFDQADLKDVYGNERDYPFRTAPRRYAPLGALAPRYWVPFLQTTPFASRVPWLPLRIPGCTPTSVRPCSVGLFASAGTGSVDPVRHYAWSATATWRTDAAFLGGNASFVLNRWLPVYSASVARSADAITPLYRVRADDPELPDGSPNLERFGWYWQRRHTVAVAVDYPYTFKTGLFARYSLSWLDNLDAIPDETVRERLPLRGRLGSLQGGWRYAWNQQAATSISTEDGRVISVVGGLVHPWLGAASRTEDGGWQGLTALQATAELREYRVMPWLRNHVLAVRAGAGATLGTDRYLGLYQLGGSFGDSAFYVTPSSSRMIRGYDLGADVGDLYWLGSVEYRLPLYRHDRGLGTWPIFFRAASLQTFVDAGNALSRPQAWSDLGRGSLVGVGAEIRASAVLWYGVPASLRFGFAAGLTDGGRTPLREGSFDPGVFYARLGSSF